MHTINPYLGSAGYVKKKASLVRILARNVFGLLRYVIAAYCGGQRLLMRGEHPLPRKKKVERNA